MFIGDRLIRWDKPLDPSERPDLKAAIEQYQNKQKQQEIATLSHNRPAPWMNWRATLTYAAHGYFSDALGFLVNVPSLQQTLTDLSKTQDWYWEAIAPQDEADISQVFGNDIQKMFAYVFGENKSIQGGWILEKTYGRIDEDCTYSQFTYLLSTENYYLHLFRYQETVH